MADSCCPWLLRAGCCPCRCGRRSRHGSWARAAIASRWTGSCAVAWAPPGPMRRTRWKRASASPPCKPGWNRAAPRTGLTMRDGSVSFRKACGCPGAINGGMLGAPGSGGGWRIATWGLHGRAAARLQRQRRRGCLRMWGWRRLRAGCAARGGAGLWKSLRPWVHGMTLSESEL